MWKVSGGGDALRYEPNIPVTKLSALIKSREETSQITHPDFVSFLFSTCLVSALRYMVLQSKFAKENYEVYYCGEPALHRLTSPSEEKEGGMVLDEVILQMQGILVDKLLPPYSK